MTRIGWLLGSVLTAVALLVAAVVVAIPPLSVGAGNQAMDRGRPFDAENLYGRAMSVPVASEWIPSFNRGVARYEQEKWDSAAADFGAAAASAPAEKHCAVSLNWAAALESGADALLATEDLQGAGLRYQQALVVLGSTVCPEDQAGLSDGSQADHWSESRDRLTGKATNATPPSDGDPSDGDAPPPDSDDELAERIARAQQERQNAEQGEDPRQGDGDGERTW